MGITLVNRASGIAAVALSLVALVTISVGLLQHALAPSGAQLCAPDEGALAHIFQLAIGLLLPALAVFVFSADWTAPARALRPLGLTAAALALAFGALYYGEHHLCRGDRSARATSTLAGDLPGPRSHDGPK
jgi:hypothetical protein